MDIQRLRNLTTGRLHTDIKYFYIDLGALVGDQGLVTHMLPRVLDAVRPWLKDNVTEPRFWEDKYDPSHVGEYPLPKPTAAEQSAMFERFSKMPNPLENLDKVVVIKT